MSVAVGEDQARACSRKLSVASLVSCALMMFALLFDGDEQAEKARAVLEPEGYEITLPEQADGLIVVVAIPGTVASSAETVMTRMRSLADELGCEALGHGGLASYGLG